jgi:hypothetical protein
MHYAKQSPHNWFALFVCGNVTYRHKYSHAFVEEHDVKG